MIRIYLAEQQKVQIEKMFIEDAKKNSTGLFKVLEKEEIKVILKKDYEVIYKTLYCRDTGHVKEKAVERLLLADRSMLKEYIKEFGTYSSENESGTKRAEILLKNVFKYDNYSKRKVVIDILRKMKVTVCPYCNRQYIYTLKNGKVRPQLDHYFPKSKYPYLAVSLYNMIPCCSVCNQSKADLDTFDKPILYPFDEEMGYETKFEIELKGNRDFVRVIQGVSDKFEIHLNVENDVERAKSVNNQKKKLHLDNLYNEHKEYVRDIIKSRYVNSTERIKELLQCFPELFSSYDEVKNLLYMTDLEKEHWGNRPLAKLTHDIDFQLNYDSEGGSITRLHYTL